MKTPGTLKVPSTGESLHKTQVWATEESGGDEREGEAEQQGVGAAQTTTVGPTPPEPHLALCPPALGMGCKLDNNHKFTKSRNSSRSDFLIFVFLKQHPRGTQ